MSEMISFNGHLLPRDGFGLSPENRSFRYGDGLFETIRVENGKVLWADRHFKRLTKGAALLKFELPADFNEKKFVADIQNICLQNHDEETSVRVRFSLYRNQGGFYIPEKNTATYLIETSKLPGSYYSLNRKGLLIDVFEDYYKPCHALSGIKTASALIYVVAGLFRNERKLDDCLLINDERLLAEAISSNLFLVKGKRIITPSLDQGCVEGVMRSVVLEIASAEGFIVEERPVDAQELPLADEIFLTNAISGISWVVGFREKRYYNETTKRLSEALNRAKRAHDPLASGE